MAQFVQGDGPNDEDTSWQLPKGRGLTCSSPSRCARRKRLHMLHYESGASPPATNQSPHCPPQQQWEPASPGLDPACDSHRRVTHLSSLPSQFWQDSGKGPLCNKSELGLGPIRPQQRGWMRDVWMQVTCPSQESFYTC